MLRKYVRLILEEQLLLEDARANLKNQGWPDELIGPLMDIGGEDAGAWVGRAMMAIPIPDHPREWESYDPKNWRILLKKYKSLKKGKKLQRAEDDISNTMRMLGVSPSTDWPRTPEQVIDFMRRVIAHHASSFKSTLERARAAGIRLKKYPTLHDLSNKLLEKDTGEDEARRIMEFGDGYYWVDLNKQHCSIEQAKMGHCGDAGEGDQLWSLRGPTGEPHVTVGVDESTGIISQLKGRQDVAPDPKYHKYIIALLANPSANNGKGISLLHTNSSLGDFTYDNISDEDMEKIAASNPNLILPKGGVPAKVRMIATLMHSSDSDLKTLAFDTMRELDAVAEPEVGNRELTSGRSVKLSLLGMKYSSNTIDSSSRLFVDSNAAKRDMTYDNENYVIEPIQDPWKAFEYMTKMASDEDGRGYQNDPVEIAIALTELLRAALDFSKLDEKEKRVVKKVLDDSMSVEDNDDYDDYDNDEDSVDPNVHIDNVLSILERHKEMFVARAGEEILKYAKVPYQRAVQDKLRKSYAKAAANAMSEALGDVSAMTYIMPWDEFGNEYAYWAKSKGKDSDKLYWLDFLIDKILANHEKIPNPKIDTDDPRDADINIKSFISYLSRGIGQKFRKKKKSTKKKISKKVSKKA